jgi:hypothetical protein
MKPMFCRNREIFWRISATIVLLQLELSRVLRVDEPGDVARRAVSTFRIISLYAFAVE